MEASKKIAVYMDHFMANIIEYTNTAAFLKTIKSDFNQYEKKKILKKLVNLILIYEFMVVKIVNFALDHGC